jgi:parallel beta helix pectate lyase-like protein
MNWQVILRNQWFQLCLVAALCSAGAGIFDLATISSPPNPKPPSPAPSSSPSKPSSPAPLAQLYPKTSGHWIVDASGAADSDSRNLGQVVASAAQGDTVTIRPGRYEASLEIDKDLKLVGEGTSPATPLIFFNRDQSNVILILAGHVTLSNLQIEQDFNGIYAALFCGKQSAVELSHCSVTSKGVFGAAANEDAQLEVSDSSFRSSPMGNGLVYQERARGAVTNTSFIDNKSGLQVENQSRVTVDSCTFRDNGYQQNHGNAVYVGGSGATLEVARSAFLNNSPSVAIAEESGKLTMTACNLENNGISLEADHVTDGMMVVQTGAQATLTNLNCKSNKQGIAVSTAATAQLNNVSLSETGIVTNNEKYQAYCNAIYLDGDGTTASISRSTISGAQYNGISIVNGAKAIVQNCSISNCRFHGLVFGSDAGTPGYGSVNDSTVFSNHRVGIYLQSKSSVEIKGGEISDNGIDGVEVTSGSVGTVTSLVLVRNQGQVGLMAYSGGLIKVKGCTIEKNQFGIQAGLEKGPEFAGNILLESSIVRDNSGYGAISCAGSTITLSGATFKNRQNFWEDGGTIHR